MLNLHQNYITLKEEGMHFDDTFEMLIEVHEEMLELLGGSNEAAWFGEEVFAFRHKSTIGWWKLSKSDQINCQEAHLLQSFHMKITASVKKRLHQDCSPCYLHLHIFFYIHSRCCNHSFPLEIRLQNTIQIYILREYFSVRIGFNMNNKCHSLLIVCTMFV